MAIGGIERVWLAGPSLLENFPAHVASLGGANRAGSRCPTFLSLLDERMVLGLYRTMAMTKLRWVFLCVLTSARAVKRVYHAESLTDH